MVLNTLILIFTTITKSVRLKRLISTHSVTADEILSVFFVFDSL